MLKMGKGWACWVVCLLACSPLYGFAQEVKSRGGLPHGAGITRDALGIPHLVTKNERDLVFLQNYVHAQDRLFNLNLLWSWLTNEAFPLFIYERPPNDSRPERE